VCVDVDALEGRWPLGSIYIANLLPKIAFNILPHENTQIVTARAQEIGEILNRITWQLNMLAIRPDIVSANAKVYEPAIAYWHGKLSDDVSQATFVTLAGVSYKKRRS